MAINVEIIEHSRMHSQGGMPGGVPQVPDSIRNISAAGELALLAPTKFVTIRNRTGGDSVYALLRAAGSTAAAVGNSNLLAAGQSVTYALPRSTLGTAMEVDIRAIA